MHRWFIPQAIDYPDQIVQMFPSLTQLSLAVAKTACAPQNAACPLPLPTLWQESGAYIVSNGPETQSGLLGGTQWDAWASALLRLQGSGRLYAERITLYENGISTSDAFLDNHGMMLSESYKATFPGGAAYTLDTGFLSLWAGENTISWQAGSNGSTVTFNRTLPDAYLIGYIPSISYGLHVGSAVHNVPGSLFMSGYDSSRCISEPVVSDGSSFQLSQVTLDVASGGSAYVNAPSPSTNLLSTGTIDVYPNPGVPYLYLPKDTCDAIASHLPVTYNSAFNLYFWNTKDPAYHQIISSPHSLDFTFTSNGQSYKISIPFALLNLTLESPLVSTATPYFPCSPWSSTDVPYHLGRAFLQGAFIAQNWQTKKMFLGQAPGPDLSQLSPYIREISSSDTTIAPATNPPSWADTWSTTLKALPSNGNNNKGGSGLSGGAIAGIVIGVLAVLAIVGVLIWIMFRRRRQQRSTAESAPAPSHQETSHPEGSPAYQNGEIYAYRKEPYSPPIYHEVESPPAEVDSQQVSELPGHGLYSPK